MRNAEAKLHSIGQLTTVVSTLKVMLTPNRDYWTGALGNTPKGVDIRANELLQPHNVFIQGFDRTAKINTR